MKKIPTLYERNRDTGLVYDELSSPYLGWVINGEGRATVKIDGTSCRVTEDGLLWKRYDRKPTKHWAKIRHREQHEHGADFRCQPEHAREAPNGWDPCQDVPDPITGHWPGWAPVDGQNPGDQWHMEALERQAPLTEGTYELIGPKVQGNPYAFKGHVLVPHGAQVPARLAIIPESVSIFAYIHQWLKTAGEEGIVWWYGSTPRVKLKASDFGIDWKSYRTKRLTGQPDRA